MLAAHRVTRIKGVGVSVIASAVGASGKLHAHTALECGVRLGNRRVNADAGGTGVDGASVAIAALCVCGTGQRRQFEVKSPAVQFGDGQRQVGVVGTDRQMTRKRHRLVVGAAVVKPRLSWTLEALVTQRFVCLTRPLSVATCAPFAHCHASLRLDVKRFTCVGVTERLALAYTSISHFNAFFAQRAI